MASKGLYANMNARKKAGISRPKSESTVSPAAYKNMKAGFPKKMKEGGMLKAVPEDKKKSLGKLPTPVREKMGFMKEGGDVKRGLRPPLNKRSRRKFTGRKLEGPPPKKQTRSEKRGGVPTEEQRLRMESYKIHPRRKFRRNLMKEGGMVIVDRQYLKGK